MTAQTNDRSPSFVFVSSFIFLPLPTGETERKEKIEGAFDDEKEKLGKARKS